MANDLKPTEAAAAILTDAKEQVKALISESHPMLVITVESSLTRLIGNLAFLTGGTVGTTVTKEELDLKFPPDLTDAEKDPSSVKGPVTEETLKPDPSAKEIFKGKVVDFMKNIPDLPSDKILDAFTLPEDQQVIRGAAKMAGLDDYKKAEINTAYLDKIRTAVVAQNEELAEKEKTNATIDK